MDNETAPFLMPVRDAVRWSGLSRTRLYLALGAGEIAARRCGRRTLIETESLRAFLAALPAATVSRRPASAPDRAAA